MAVDTREKRQSALAFLFVGHVPGIEPSTLNMAARQAALWVYSGISSGLITIARFMAGYRRRRMM